MEKEKLVQEQMRQEERERIRLAKEEKLKELEYQKMLHPTQPAPADPFRNTVHHISAIALLN